LVGHVPGDRLVDEPVELGGADLVGEGCDMLVDVSGGVGAQSLFNRYLSSRACPR
jgi:hypothetical protein